MATQRRGIGAWIGGLLLAAVALLLVPAHTAGTSQTPQPALKPGYVGAAKCMNCHEVQAKGYRDSPHGRAWDPRTPAADAACETCHGAGSAHLADVGAKGRLRNFTTLAPRETSETCMTCHNREEHSQWQGSLHDARNITCVSCHSVHTPKSEKGHLKMETITATCGQCHRDKVAKIQRSAHMPVREGKMECTTCHNQHGSSNVRLLRTGNSVGEFCTSCHAEKRGPFLWDHEPVRENCLTCHDPHGSSNDRLLVSKVPMLCQRCHIGTGHPTALYDATTVAARNQRVVGRSCVNCHPQIHGSNHPSGQFFQR
jgi:DmsE family decaheme c-type cytochrome